MELPNANRALVGREKIVGYLLEAGHPDNGGKAKFFLGLGFEREAWAELAAAFVKLAAELVVSRTALSPHGRKYVMVAKEVSLTGKMAKVQTVWIVDRGLDVPRLVTAYPFKE